MELAADLYCADAASAGRETHLERVAVYECLGDEGAGGVGVLNLLSGHILTLTQLEDVLLAVDDAQSAVGQPLANIAAAHHMLQAERTHAPYAIVTRPVEPAFRVDRFGGLLRRLVLSTEDVRASEANLSARGSGGRQVVHLRHVTQAHFVARHGAADVTGSHVIDARESGCCTASDAMVKRA